MPGFDGAGPSAGADWTGWGTVCFGLKSLRRRALVTTLTELRLMAAAPNMGESCQCRRG